VKRIGDRSEEIKGYGWNGERNTRRWEAMREAGNTEGGKGRGRRERNEREKNITKVPSSGLWVISTRTVNEYFE